MSSWTEFFKNDDYMGVKKYIKDGADVNETNESGEPVLALALKNKCDMDLLKLLVENGADLYDFDDEGVSIFDSSVTYNNIEMVKYMIEQGIDVNFTQRRSGFTPLMAAASYGRADIAKLLIDNGANQEAVDAKGFSAIDFARKMNKKSVLDVLDYDKNSPKNNAYAR
ncbi:ankyrin repeat domain-containing protein [Sulfurimonas sp.]|uniref:ankyrin repeat domain-containing protein n=1 Tax=Sulfurimonas sp. TaxID=2022749 RepID=UPI0025FE5F94|nr:ankyrin repeat domain-containing protein [Sulfurimonas sp.]